MPTERKRAIRTAAAWGADQAAMEALYGVGGYYTSLSLWEAGEQADLTALDELRTAVCYNDWPSGLNNNVTVAGWTTDATRYVKITVAEGHRHDGTPGSGFFLTTTTQQVQVVRSSQAATVIEWIDAYYNTAIGNDGRAFYVTSPCTLRNCIARSAYTDGSTLNYCLDSTVASDFISCLAIGGYNALRNSGRTLNCVVTGATLGVMRLGAAVVKNTIAYDNNTNWGAGSYDAGSSNNATGSATDDTPNANAGITGVTSAAFVNAAGNDFHLSASSVLRGAGVNLYSILTHDIDGDPWPSSGAWDIGFDYYVAAGGSLTINSITASNITSSGARITLGLTR